MMIVFVGTSFANDIAEKELVLEESKEVLAKVEAVENDYWDCAKIANDVYHELIKHFTKAEALDNANQYFNYCMDDGCRPPFRC